jgi:hypothetical protein
LLQRSNDFVTMPIFLVPIAVDWRQTSPKTELKDSKIA